MNSKKIDFENKEGISLSANLEMPLTGKPMAYAIFAHCFTCSKNLSAVVNISRSLTQASIAVLRFDFTGLGNSEGNFSDTNFSSNIEDLHAAYDFLEAKYDPPEIIIGHSLGGAAVLAAAGGLKSVKSVVTIGSPSDPLHVKHLLSEGLDEITNKGEATVSIGGRPFKIKKQFLDDLEKNDLRVILGSLNKALLILHSPQDNTVSIENARKIYEGAMHPKSFVTLDGADHLLTKKDDSLYVGNLIASWATRYLDLKPKDDLVTNKQLVSKTGDDGYTTELRAGNHSFLADEPSSVGGKDLGPTPYDYLVAALGSCTSMTLRMYANRKKWPLEAAVVHLEHNKVHEEDCENCEKNSAKIDQIEREIELIGNLSGEQREKLLEIADKCPVHKTLHNEIKVVTKLI
ncbi:MAG: alpha/beta fold hydrolase [Bacteroidota bacterium]